MKDETELHDKYTENNNFPESWQISLPHGKFVRMPKEHAEALYKAAQILIPLEWNIVEFDGSAVDNEIREALDFLRKGIGRE